MLKRSLFFGQPAYLSTRHQQLWVHYPEDTLLPPKSVPIEDVGFVVIENRQVSLTAGLMAKLMAHNVVIIHCNELHLPVGYSVGFAGHTEFSERARAQIEAGLPLKKQFWQQVVAAKIQNQAGALLRWGETDAARKLERYANQVLSGDSSRLEATAAAHYWKFFRPNGERFLRDAEGEVPNAHLNYGYAIVRAAVARGLSGAGLLPVLGLYHSNKYNAFCLADDLMEPYRPFVDDLVWQMAGKQNLKSDISTAEKQALLGLLVRDVAIDGNISPCMNAIERSCKSLALGYLGQVRKLHLPEWPN